MRSAIIVSLVFYQILGCLSAIPNYRLNFFDNDLLRSTADKAGNVVISPASIKSTLAMILEGAEGVTATEIKSALRVSPVKDDFRKELHLFLKALEVNTTNVLLRNANAVFVSKKIKLKKAYENIVQGIYFSEVGRLDFSNPTTAVDTINRWVNDKTHGLIPSIVNEAVITPYTELLITNALYFTARWKYGFNTNMTHRDCFYNKDVCRNVAMMELQAELKYAFVDNLKAHALELPYQGDRYSMILLVPQYHDAAGALVRDLPYIGLPQIIDMMDPVDVVLTMPKFTIDYSTNLIEALKDMRINSLFSPSANLSGIFESGDVGYVNSIYQSVYMKVDEVGTEAAASTISLVVPLINNQVQLRVDRPFLFFIRDKQLGLDLFGGKIEEPTEFHETVSNKVPDKPVKVQPILTEPITKTIFFPSRHSTSDLAGSSYSSLNQAYPNLPSVQSNLDVHQSSQTAALSTTPSHLTSSPSRVNEKPKSNGIGAWFKSIFTGGR